MTCPVCGGKTCITNSRPSYDIVRRRRECHDCGHRFTTQEIEVDVLNKLLKKTEKPRNTESRPVVCIETGVTFRSARHAAQVLGLNQSHISKCCRGVYSKTGGLHFKFLEDKNHE